MFYLIYFIQFLAFVLEIFSVLEYELSIIYKLFGIVFSSFEFLNSLNIHIQLPLNQFFKIHLFVMNFIIFPVSEIQSFLFYKFFREEFSKFIYIFEIPQILFFNSY